MKSRMFSEIFEEIDSTNKYLKSRSFEPKTAVLAFSQTAGRGRLGRTFSSPEGGLYMSVVLKMDNSMTLTSKAAVAVTRALKAVCNIDADIKWVNDIYLHGKKICGILAEGSYNNVVVGIGINYCTRKQDIPEELKNIAGSVYDGPENAPDKILFAESVVENLIQLSETEDKSWLEEYRSKSILTGKKVNIIQAGEITGTGIVTQIDESCALHVMTDTEERILTTGEVSIRFAN